MSIKQFILTLFVVSYFSCHLFSQSSASPELSVEFIMRDPKWMGTSPDDIRWSEDSRYVYFDWNPDHEPGDSLYKTGIKDLNPRKVSLKERREMPSPRGVYNKDRSLKLYEKHGDLFQLSLKDQSVFPITGTVDRESSPEFDLTEKYVIYRREDNLYRWNRNNGTTEQLTDFKKGSEQKDKPVSPQQEWVSQQELSLIRTLKERKEEREVAKAQRDLLNPDRPTPYYMGSKSLRRASISPDGRYVIFQLYEAPKGVERTKIPNYIQESGYTGESTAYGKTGSPEGKSENYIQDLAGDSIYPVQIDSLPGIYQLPLFLEEYGRPTESGMPRATNVMAPVWSDDGKYALVEVRSQDFKDRWLTLLDLNTGRLRSMEHQHDEAWIGGPGIPQWAFMAGETGWLPDNKHIWFMSEKTGYSHLYTLNVETGEKNQLTSGEFEVFSPQISRDGKYWYYSSSAVHPGERHFYRMPLEGGESVKITSMAGNNEVAMSPDEKYLAIRHSTGNRPWELFIQPNKPGAKAEQVTESLTEEFRSYPWREPEYVTFTAGDGAEVHARLYRPEGQPKGGPAVIFVHGAGYLQNAHKWWSRYFREYMFHNLLADKGYTVLDIDYRGSEGYGRNWRTGIYREMGGKDLSDQVDGAGYLVETIGVDRNRIGIYGGSYGGFITLMAMFRHGDVFSAGAALRSVTDWSHYHHAYTAAILNSPQDDSIAYVRSSPIYYAEGLQGPLLMCHGMVDNNVHFQDIVRLSQRLIELGKEDWELAVYPMESHSFVEPSSWTDEYKRILRLFEMNLK